MYMNLYLIIIQSSIFTAALVTEIKLMILFSYVRRKGAFSTQIRNRNFKTQAQACKFKYISCISNSGQFFWSMAGESAKLSVELRNFRTNAGLVSPRANKLEVNYRVVCLTSSRLIEVHFSILNCGGDFTAF